jgi:hypothetical protein
VATATYQKKDRIVRLMRAMSMSQGWRMKKILTLGFLLHGLQPLSAQTLPSYDLSYYDSPECIKEKAKSFAKNTLIPNKSDEAVGASICQVAKAAGPSSHEDMAKRWDTIPSEVRWKCINALENDRKTGRIPTMDYVILALALTT